MITRTTVVTSMVLLAALTAGCDRLRSDTPKPVAASDQGKPAEQSVALPPASVPPSDASIKPVAPDAAGSSGQATSQTQSSPKTLEKSQEQASMPMSGQANNHSTPESTDKQPGAKTN